MDIDDFIIYYMIMLKNNPIQWGWIIIILLLLIFLIVSKTRVHDQHRDEMKKYLNNFPGNESRQNKHHK